MNCPTEEKRTYYVYGFWQRDCHIVMKDGKFEYYEFDDIDKALERLRELSLSNVNITWCLTWDKWEMEPFLKNGKALPSNEKLDTRAEKAALKAYPILFSERSGLDKTMEDRRISFENGYVEGYKEALEEVEKEIEHRTLNAHDMPDGAKDKEFYCGMDAAFSDIMVYIDSLND